MTVQINHHIVITDAEQQAIVNALAFYDDMHRAPLDAHEKEQYRLAFHEDDRGCAAVEVLAKKIATSN